MKLRLALATIAIALVAACSVKYPVVGAFDRYNEVLIGTVDHNLAVGAARITIQARNSGIKCAGRSVITNRALLCSAQRGFARFACDDGTTAKADWVATSCTTGFGSGRDDRGRAFQFAFGMSAAEARRYMRRASAQAADRPEYETYRPKETRKALGFSTGTGFLVSRDGVIVTNRHVLNGADEIGVVIGDKVIPATLLAEDAKHDIAVIRAEVSARPIAIGDAGSVGIADEVMTLGYPLIQRQGQALKATFGRVNALSGIGDDDRFLQIDVPVQPGNSGGPLFNTRGEAVGIVTATLANLETLAATGVLPQSVNYAVKATYLDALLRDMRKPSRPKRTLSFKEIVETYKDSVFLIVAVSE